MDVDRIFAFSAVVVEELVGDEAPRLFVTSPKDKFVPIHTSNLLWLPLLGRYALSIALLTNLQLLNLGLKLDYHFLVELTLFKVLLVPC